MIVALAGGVGAAKFLSGLSRVIDPSRLGVIVNTGDDIWMHGLRVSPDLDILTYTLAGIVDEVKGWGIRGDTFESLRQLGQLGAETWFQLGDRDMATHIFRTSHLRAGFPLSHITNMIKEALGVSVKILPMTDEEVETRIHTDRGDLHFEEYLVRERSLPRLESIYFKGIETARPAEGALDLIREAEGIVFCPSNPVVSIGPILAVPGIRGAITESPARKVAISPIVGGKTIKGPADLMLRALGYEVSAAGVARVYEGLIDAMVIDRRDAHLEPEIRRIVPRVAVTDTIMTDEASKTRLARETMEFMGW